MLIMINELAEKFHRIYHEPASNVFFAPGRVNLIGEHTDYNGGHVFPCAITQGTYGLISPRKDSEIHCLSLNFEELGIQSFSVDGPLSYQRSAGWLNYVKGVVKYIQEQVGEQSLGFNLLVYGNIPNGAGLSSSASLELLIGVILRSLNGFDIRQLDLIKIGQKVENQFIGLKSGIMDQFAIGMGQKDQALFLDVNTLDYQLVPADFGEYVILIMNTNKRRELETSKYNERRSQCEEGLKKLQSELAIQTLGDLDAQTFESYRYLIDDPILEARAKHAVYENERTIKAMEVLQNNDLETFGKLLNQSHTSLRDDYDVTGLELDTLVESAWSQEGVLGARMTGAGMGGCAIALVHQAKVDEISEQIATHYQAVVGYSPSFYIAEIGDGARELEM